MPTVRCLHCDKDNDPIQTAGYCEECGKQLPAGSGYAADLEKPFRPPFADDENRDPYRSVKREDSPELAIAKKQASGSLFAVALIQLICGGIGLVALSMFDKDAALPPEALVVAGVILVGIAGLFAALGW